ncbi:MAG: CoB--CoM heterodisulfide reductase iron-sulfur subunit A family protein [Deltaproteobacteria bacterium]|nr:CoB--CoM heterodisulfide reductase iron-sulfur subunit A family protein [Deltaproteobacteria bacterium]
MSERNQGPGIGVYVCHCGGNISDHVDVDKVAEAAARMPDVVTARLNPFMCSDPGQDLIMEDIKAGLIDRVVVASCSPSLHETTFRNALVRAGMNPYLYVHANIREQVSWVAEGEGATKKAVSLVASAVAKARLIRSLDPIRVEAKDHATVIGGGVAGLKAARDLAMHGLQVVLVEKTPFLGGWVARLDTLFPTGDDAVELLNTLYRQVSGLHNVEILTCAQLVAQEGYIGNFRLKVTRRPPQTDEERKKLAWVRASGQVGAGVVPFVGICPAEPPDDPEESEFTTGAVIMATGFSAYEPRRGEYGYKEHPEVVTLAELIRQMAGGTSRDGHLVINGKPVKTMAMIHCVGSRQIPGLHEPGEDGRLNQYCSRTCCNSLLHAALRIRREHPETVIFNLYRDIRTYGRGHEEAYIAASENQVRFIRFLPGTPPAVRREDNGYALSVTVRDALFHEDELEIPVDLVVLGTGMQPAPIKELTEVMKCQTGRDGFLQEVHPKIRPVEVASAGIFLAGTCQAPMDMTETVAAASAASAKAGSILSVGAVELEPFVSRVDTLKCSACCTCLRACPYGVPKIVDGAAYIEPASCYGCGACAAECPGKAITLEHSTDEQVLAGQNAIIRFQPPAVGDRHEETGR